MKLAHVYRHKGSLYVRPFCQTTAGVWIGADCVVRLDPNASPLDKGEAVVEALDRSDQVIPHPTHWDNVEEDALLRLAGVKSWSTFMKTARSVGIELEGSIVRIEPARNLGPKEGFEPLRDKQIEVSISSPQGDIGEALEAALRLCE